MENIRIGNSVHVSWRLYNNNGSQYALSGKIRRLWIISAALEKEITSYGIQGRNEIVFSVPADDLIRYGTYKIRLTIRESESETEDATYDLTQIFQVVSQSYPNASNAIGGVADLSFTSVLNNVVIERIEGLSAYEIAVNNGYEGTEQEWIAMYDNAVTAANNAAEEAIAATETVMANEESRQLAESARDSAEQARMVSEQSRVSAERAREQAEQVRQTAEQGRASSEQSRTIAETARETRAASDHATAQSDHATAANDHSVAVSDHTAAATDHTIASSDHSIAVADHEASTLATEDANDAADAANDAAASVQHIVETRIGSETIHNIVELTQAEYDALQTKRDDTMYIITDTTKVYIGSRIIKENVKANEEDIDFDSSDKLQFADRVYNSSTPDGMGYKILRKNKTFAQQVTATNTIYEIRYDFDLGAASVTIPAGCVLKFNGGSVVNGTIVGTQTLINSENMCFGKDVTISGTWSNETIYTKWLDFVSSNDGTTDNSVCFKQLQGLINGTSGCKVEFENGYYQTQIIGMEPEGSVEVDGVTYPKWAMNTYQVDSRVVLNIFELPRLEINLNGSTIKAINITCPGWNMIRLNGVKYGYVHDGTLIGMADGFDYPDYVNYNNTVNNNYGFSSLLYQVGGSCRIQNMACEYSTGDGITVGSGNWYFRTGDVRPTGVVQANGVVRFPAEGYSVVDCEVCYCGRNGITLHSSEDGTLKNCHIHHIGSDAGNGNIGSDGIQGRSPRAGIDVEFEDGQGLMPIMRWEGLYIHDCGGKSFGFASESQSKMRQFSARNCRFIRLGVHNNLNAEGPKEFVNCYFEHNGGQGSLLGAGSTFRDCQFILKTHSLPIGAQTFENCVITDEYAEENNSNYMFSENRGKAIFRNCILTIKHPYGYLQDKTFYDCVLNLYAKKIIFACGIEFYNCEFHKDPDDDTAYSFCFASGNNPILTRGHFWFVGCTFDTLRGTGDNVSSYAFTSTYPIVIDGCKFRDRLSFYAGSNGPDITIRDSTFNVLDVSRYNDAGDNVKPVLIDGCVVDSFSIGSAGTRAVEVKDSKIGIVAGGNYKLRKVHFTRCEVTNSVARSNYYPDVDVTAVDSILNFVVATSTSAFDLTKCYVKGLVTEASFQGAKKDCTFETSFPKSGATTARPSASAVGAGFTYFDTDLGKMVVSNGTDWVNMDGSSLS